MEFLFFSSQRAYIRHFRDMGDQMCGVTHVEFSS